jgi:hypothetical protein
MGEGHGKEIDRICQLGIVVQKHEECLKTICYEEQCI